MRLKLLWALGLSLALSLAYSQLRKKKEEDESCAKILEHNSILILENRDLAIKLNSKELDYETLKLNYRELQRDRNYHKSNCKKEKINRDSIADCHKFCYQKFVTVTKERDDIKGQLDSLRNIWYSNAPGIKPVPPRFTLNGSVLAMLDKLKALEDESADNISVQYEYVHFRGKNYKYRKEILFIPYKGENRNDSMQMNDSLTYSFTRLIKLISKYDFGVKIKLVGECNMHGFKEKRKQNSIDRADNLKTYLKGTPYNLSDQFFAKSPQEGELDNRTGVSIIIVRK